MSEKLITPGTVQKKEHELANKKLPDDVVIKVNEAIMRAYLVSPNRQIIKLIFSWSGDDHSIPMKYQLQVAASMKRAGFICLGRPNTLIVKFGFPITARQGENNG